MNTYADEISRISILKSIVNTISEENDTVKIFHLAIQKIQHYVTCEQITVLYYLSQSGSFYLTPALNINLDLAETSVIARNTFLYELVETMKPVNWADISTSDLQGDDNESFLPDDTQALLAVPVINAKELYAVLLLTSSQKDAFDESDQALVEEISLLISLGLQKVQLEEELEQRRGFHQQVSRLNRTLFESISEPAAIINHEEDLIYEANRAFEKLTSNSFEDLSGKRFSEIHAELVHHPYRESLRNDEQVTIQHLEFIGHNGEHTVVDLNLIPFESNQKSLVLARFCPGDTIHPASEQFICDKLVRFLALGNEASDEIDQETRMKKMLLQLGHLEGAKYVTLHVQTDKHSVPALQVAYRIENHASGGIEQTWNLGLNESPFMVAHAGRKPVAVNDIQQDSAFETWRPVAQKLGYNACIALPLKLAENHRGVLTLFYEEQKHFSDAYIKILDVLARYIATMLERDQLHRLALTGTQALQDWQTAAKQLHLALHTEEIIENAATSLVKLLPFDLMTVLLYDEAGEAFKTYAIISAELNKNIQIGLRKPLAEKSLFWLHLKAQSAQSVDQIEKALALNVKSRTARLSSMLSTGDSYLGDISLMNTRLQQYTDAQTNFMNQFSTEIAVALKNGRQFEDAEIKIAELSGLARISKCVNSGEAIDQILNCIAKATERAFFADVCLIRIIDDNFKLPELSAIFASQDVQFTSQFIEPYLQELMQSDKPVYIQDLNELAKEMPSVAMISAFSSYLGVPIRIKDETQAILSIFWKEIHDVSERQLTLISEIAFQAASAIQNIQLQQDSQSNSEQLRKANEELENFVYTVSHDLKSPIVSIQGFATIMLNEYRNKLDAEAKHYLERIVVNAEQMEKLIRDLLELSRIGRVVNKFEEVEVSKIIQEAENELIYQIQEKKIKLVVESNLPKIVCDRNRMVQVFMNLLSNAVNYIGANNPDPLIEIKYEDHDTQHQFCVKDNGIGINKKYHEKIFGLFQILEQDSEKIGTGVGLTIVKRIIENHQGKIWVESEPGAGSSFYFTIPKSGE
ncbi:GAF domain-containing protein [candidate division KSB1 bacterium]|nr:GAF domain-containing protein [candidate division KSB1 bacterium]